MVYSPFLQSRLPVPLAWVVGKRGASTSKPIAALNPEGEVGASSVKIEDTIRASVA